MNEKAAGQAGQRADEKHSKQKEQLTYKGPKMGTCLAYSREGKKMAIVAGAKLVRDEVRKGRSQNLELSESISVEMESLWSGVVLQNVI